MPLIQRRKYEEIQDERIASDLVNKLQIILEKEKLPEEKIKTVIKNTIEKIEDEEFAKLFLKAIKDKKLDEKYNLNLS